MEVVKIKEKRYTSIEKFMNENNINSEKTVYNWVNAGKAEMKKLLNKSFFRRMD